MTTLALVLLLVAVVGLAVATTVGYIRGGLPVATPDVPPPLDAPVAEPADLDRARFGLAFRGYRMDQVDEVLDGARDALTARDAEIARLRGQLLGVGADDELDAVPDWRPQSWYATDEARADTQHAAAATSATSVATDPPGEEPARPTTPA